MISVMAGFSLFKQKWKVVCIYRKSSIKPLGANLFCSVLEGGEAQKREGLIRETGLIENLKQKMF